MSGYSFIFLRTSLAFGRHLKKSICVTGSVPIALHISTYLILTAALQGGHYHPAHFTLEETKAERTEREIEMRHREKWGPPEIGTRRDRKRRRGSFVFKGVKCKPTQVSQSEPPHRGSWGEKTRCHVRKLGFHFHLHHLT